MSQKTKPKAPAPEWHSDAIGLLKKHFSSVHSTFLDASRRAHWFGMLLVSIKLTGKEDGSIPHGRFGPWLKQNLPEIHWDTACVYMFMAKSAAEITKLKIMDFPKFAHGGELPDPILKLIEGKTQRRCFLEYKQCKTDVEGNLIPAPGRRPGEGGKEAEPREVEANIEYHRKYCLRHMGLVDQELQRIGLRFLHNPDDQITAWVASLERTVKVANHWLNTPRDKRDPKAAEKLWRQH